MFYFTSESTDPYFNLAAEEALLSISEPSVRLWQNDPAIIVGRHQNTFAEVNAEAVDRLGIKVVRRLTGGGAVYHDHGNLNFTFIVPSDRRKSGFDFSVFTAPVIKALARLGVHAELSGRNDLVINGRKFSGNAQAKIQEKILHHGTLLFNTDLDRMSDLLNVAREKFQSHAVESVRSRVVNITECLPENSLVKDLASFRDFLSEELIRTCHAEIHSFDETLLKRIAKLRNEKYITRHWNYGQSPQCGFRSKKRFSWGEIEVVITVDQGMITNAAFYGDFFSGKEPDLLIQKLIGLSYEKDRLLSSITEENIREIFPCLSLEEFADLLFSAAV